MKPLYLIVLFFIIFQMSALIISALNVFPYGLYSDLDLAELSNQSSSPQGMITYLFVPDGTLKTWIDSTGADFLIPSLVGCFLGIGVIVSYLSQSFAPISIAIVGLLLTPMITKSLSFFNQLFSKGGSQALLYLGGLFGVCILVIVIITIIEMPTQGRS